MAVDLSQLSDADLAALEAGDLTRMSDAGLAILEGGEMAAPPVAAPQQAQPVQAPQQPPAPVRMVPVNIAGVPFNIPESAIPDIVRQGTGALETVMSMLSGATTGAMGMVPGAAAGLTEAISSGKFGTQEGVQLVEDAAMRGAGRFTYQPRTPEGQRYLAQVGATMAPAVPLMTGMAPMLPEMAPAVGASARAAGQVARGTRAAGQAMESPVPVAAPMARQPYGAAQDAGAAATQAAERRLVTAESLPVPVRLTRGAATREAQELAFEKEAMRLPEGARLRQRAEENNLQALQNFDALIDMTEAQTPALGPQATGKAVYGALLEGYQRAKNRTNVAYAAARRSPGAQEPVDFARPVSVGMDDPMPLFDYLASRPNLPSETMATTAKTFAQRLGFASVDEDGNLVQTRPITVRDAEEWRREINGAVNIADSTQTRQASIIKSAIDETVGDAGGDLYRRARAIRRQQADLYENRAIVADLLEYKPGTADRRVALDRVVDRSIMNGSPEEIRFLSRVVRASGPNGQQAWKEMQGGLIARIRDRATSTVQTTSGDEKVISPAALNKEIEALDRNGRLEAVFGPQKAQQLRDLNEVVRYVSTVPPGTLINNSGTAATLMEAMKMTAESAVTKVMPGPMRTALELWSKASADRKLQQKIDRALNPRQKD